MLNSTFKNLLILWYEKEGRILANLVCLSQASFVLLFNIGWIIPLLLESTHFGVVCGSSLATWHIFGNDAVGK